MSPDKEERTFDEVLANEMSWDVNESIDQMAFHKNVKYFDLGGVSESQLTTKLITTLEDGSVYKG